MSYPCATLPVGLGDFFLTMEQLLTFLGLGGMEAFIDCLDHRFLALLCISTPIIVALGLFPGYALLTEHMPITTLVQTVFEGLATFPLLAIPLFMLAGNLMNEGGITQDLVRFARLLLGHIRGLGLATILACAIFAAISGAAVATAVAIGMVMIPAMKKAGYDDDLAAALTCTASCMGPIIPPSIPFIIYGVIANVSIGGAFSRRSRARASCLGWA